MTDSFPDGGKAAVLRAVEAGVDMMVLPAVDIESISPMLSLHNECSGNTAIALGLHPTEVGPDWKNELQEIMTLGSEAPIVAIGETGIDLHWEQKFLTRQMDAFGEQIQMAIDRKLPVIVHSRDAIDETVEVVKSFGSGLPGIVFHSFTSGRADAERLLEHAPDAFFGINGVITFKNATELREAVSFLDIDRIVTETDSPFLAPVPFRGRLNESSYLPHIIKGIAETKGLTEDEVRKQTVDNACRLYTTL